MVDLRNQLERTAGCVVLGGMADYSDRQMTMVPGAGRGVGIFQITAMLLMTVRENVQMVLLAITGKAWSIFGGARCLRLPRRPTR